MFEFPALMLPTNLGQPVHSPPAALTEHVSLNLAGTFLLDHVELYGILKFRNRDLKKGLVDQFVYPFMCFKGLTAPKI